MNDFKHFNSPAKLNLFLHVCGKRDDGYHNLQTIFQFIDLQDDIAIKTTTDGNVHIDSSFDEVALEDNLIYRAAKQLQDASDTTQGAHIKLNKRIPTGAGLGGGSSNAATTLVALNKLWQCKLSTQQLQNIGKKLGADVPIFIHGSSAWAEGIGEQLTTIEPPCYHYVLGIPDCHVATGKIFSHPQLTRDTKMMKIAAFLEQCSSKSWLTLNNDCQQLVASLYPEVQATLNEMSSIDTDTSTAKMTGTGACVFLAFNDEKTALSALQSLNNKASNTKYLLCKGQNTSSLYQKA